MKQSPLQQLYIRRRLQELQLRLATNVWNGQKQVDNRTGTKGGLHERYVERRLACIQQRTVVARVLNEVGTRLILERIDVDMLKRTISTLQSVKRALQGTELSILQRALDTAVRDAESAFGGGGSLADKLKDLFGRGDGDKLVDIAKFQEALLGGMHAFPDVIELIGTRSDVDLNDPDLSDTPLDEVLDDDLKQRIVGVFTNALSSDVKKLFGVGKVPYIDDPKGAANELLKLTPEQIRRLGELKGLQDEDAADELSKDVIDAAERAPDDEAEVEQRDAERVLELTRDRLQQWLEDVQGGTELSADTMRKIAQLGSAVGISADQLSS